jgi:PAS domain S-box-containing protein
MDKEPGVRRHHERARLRALREVDLEDVRPVIERISRTAQRIARTPFALVSLIGSEKVWLAGVLGAPVAPVPRSDSFAAHAAQYDGVLWIENLHADARFRSNPYVSGEAGLRFYAGAPIVTSTGERIGALSVLDRVPRSLDADVAAALEDLAALAALEWERGRAMKALKTSEARVRTSNKMLAGVIASATVAIMMTDRRMRILRVSPKWRSVFGIGDAKVRGGLVYDVFPGYREAWELEFGRVLAGEVVSFDRVQITLPNGARPWLQVELAPWRDGRGRIGGVLAISQDISTVVEALETTRRSEQTLKLAMEIGDLSMWELDHRARGYNRVGASVLPYAESSDYEYMAQNMWAGVHPADRPAAMATWERHQQDGEPCRATFRMMQHDGPHVWVQSASEAIRGANGDIERIVGVLRNIDKQKRSEIALAKAKDAAEAANRAKSEFLANMSHEIRTPLNGVMGVADALARTPLAPKQQEMVTLIESSAKTLEALLSDVLDLARVESGRLVLAKEPFDPAQCVVDVAALFQLTAEAKGLHLIVEASPNLAGAFLGDAARVRQVLSNLVSNAVKFTPSVEVRLTGSATPTPDGVEARMSVADTGIGFDEETKARLFGRFEQADGSITRRYGGSGLGLAISRSLADQMGGRLEASAAPGAGAMFTLVLPLTRASAAPPVSPKASHTPSRREARALRVLLAEDHPVNRRVAELMLEAAGVDLTCVENGALAVEAWRDGDFDLVLMDMQMPVMDGLTAIRKIRAAEMSLGRGRVPIYALTANAMPEHAEATMAAGANGHLTKPITSDALFGAVEAAASAREAVDRPNRRRRAKLARMNGG